MRRIRAIWSSRPSLESSDALPREVSWESAVESTEIERSAAAHANGKKSVQSVRPVRLLGEKSPYPTVRIEMSAK